MSDNRLSYRYLLNDVKTSISADHEEICREAARQMKRRGIQTRSLHFRLYKRSVDARRKEEIRFVSSILVESESPIPEDLQKRAGLRAWIDVSPEIVRGKARLKAPPLVVGMGPAGLFAALLLAENGYDPILIDRGDSIDDRVASVDRFIREGFLDTESNIQFGAGGAGTFSDGKLITRIHDPYCNYVLHMLCRFGAPEEILTLAKPHIGTDLLRRIIANLLSEIERLGGKVLYRTRMDDFCESADASVTVYTNYGELRSGALILAPGHSARDTYELLLKKQFSIEAKPISVGVRAEHLQCEIDRALYGDLAGHPNLGPAEYALSDTRGTRGVYTFCMCPGGEVVAAASEEGGLVVNGMSNHARNGKNANAAVAVSISCTDYEPINGSLALGAIAFQRRIERAAFTAGGGDYDAPIMTLGDLIGEYRATEPSRVLPSYRRGKIHLTDLRSVFPTFITESLRYAFSSFGKKLEGYDAPDTILTAAETRTSAPLRILRLPEERTAIGHELIYPCGEGAGYAGGITSAAVDGLRSAEALIKKFGSVSESCFN
ncbi:MAG: hypothetical protein E7680_07050 [Ruminococcaceae bacterium]|nr:hypothetical protein [Oscillospiraceae bacterium]